MGRTATHLVRLFAIGGVLLLAACTGGRGGTQQALKQVRAALAPTLPKPYIEDLVIVSVAIEGNALVEVIRSPLGTAAKTRANPRFNELRQAEEAELRGWCRDPAIQPLLNTDAALTRRFVDRNDGVFFEVTMAARACSAAITGAHPAKTP